MVTKLNDKTRDIYKVDAPRVSARLNVIYMTDQGDYCRETGPKDIHTYAEATSWADYHFNLIANSEAYRVVSGFRVEWF